MTLVKKEEEILRFSTKEFDEDEPQTKHYHKECWNKLKKDGYPGTIAGVITKETLEKESMKVLCNECGEEIKAISLVN